MQITNNSGAQGMQWDGKNLKEIVDWLSAPSFDLRGAKLIEKDGKIYVEQANGDVDESRGMAPGSFVVVDRRGLDITTESMFYQF